MRISGDFFRVIGEYGKNKKVSKVDSIQGIYGGKDTMSISSEAKIYNMVRKAINEVPDIREEKVRQLEKLYAGGTYNVSGKEVADKMVDKFFDKRV